MSNDRAFGKTSPLSSVTGHGETEGSQCIMQVSEKPKGDVLCMAQCIQCQCAGMVTFPGGATHADHKSARKEFCLLQLLCKFFPAPDCRHLTKQRFVVEGYISNMDLLV